MHQLGQNNELEYGKNRSKSCERAKSATMFGGDGGQIESFKANTTQLTRTRTPMAIIESGCK
jgi:hypothetical protein